MSQACNFIKKRGSGTSAFLWTAKFLRTLIFTEHLRWLLLNVSRNLELEKRADRNFITQHFLHWKHYCISKKKKLKAMPKGGHIWIYFGFCVVVVHFWENGECGRFILAGAGWWWIYFARWWVAVGGGGYILAAGGWWWVVA